MIQTEQKNRIPYLDILRSIAIVSITMNHAINRSFATSVNTLQEYLSIPLFMTVIKASIYIFSRLGVPLFLMITGALLLNRDYSDPKTLSRFLKHNFLSLLITTEIWLGIMFWYLKIPGILAGRCTPLQLIADFVLNQLFLNQTTMGSMWYMPMILCLYLLLPMVSLAIHKLSPKLIAVIFCLILCSSIVIPNINIILCLLGCDFTLTLALDPTYLLSNYWVYVLSGYYISKGILKNWRTELVLLFSLGSYILTVLFQIWLYVCDINYSVVYRDLGPLLAAAFLFESFRRREHLPQRITTAANRLSRIAFGIYFVHICIITGLEWTVSEQTFYYLPRFFLLELVSFFGSILIIKIVSKIDWCKKYLFLIK